MPGASANERRIASVTAFSTLTVPSLDPTTTSSPTTASPENLSSSIESSLLVATGAPVAASTNRNSDGPCSRSTVRTSVEVSGVNTAAVTAPSRTTGGNCWEPVTVSKTPTVVVMSMAGTRLSLEAWAIVAPSGVAASRGERVDGSQRGERIAEGARVEIIRAQATVVIDEVGRLAVREHHAVATTVAFEVMGVEKAFAGCERREQRRPGAGRVGEPERLDREQRSDVALCDADRFRAPDEPLDLRLARGGVRFLARLFGVVALDDGDRSDHQRDEGEHRRHRRQHPETARSASLLCELAGRAAAGWRRRTRLPGPGSDSRAASSVAASTRVPRYRSLSLRPPAAQRSAAQRTSCLASRSLRSSAIHSRSRGQARNNASWTTVTCSPIDDEQPRRRQRRHHLGALAGAIAVTSSVDAQRRASSPSGRSSTMRSSTRRATSGPRRRARRAPVRRRGDRRAHAAGGAVPRQRDRAARHGATTPPAARARAAAGRRAHRRAPRRSPRRALPR